MDEKISLTDVNAGNGHDLTVTYEVEEGIGELAYDVEDRPPWIVTLVTAFQHMFLCISSVLAIITILSDIICADINDPVRVRLFSSSVFVIGISTIAQSLFGLRLPVFQGASTSYLIPLIALRNSKEFECPSPVLGNYSINGSLGNTSVLDQDNIVNDRLAQFQGSLMAACLLEVLIGLTGIVGLVMKFISPITIGVTIFCLGYSLYPIPIRLCKAHWGVSLLGSALMVLFSVYMGHVKVPLPRCSRNSKTKSRSFPVFQIFPMLITLIIVWTICVVCTQFGVFSDDSKHPSFRARTDVRNKVIHDTPWILIPYPGQFGPLGFNTAVFVGYLICVLTSTIDSIGDYVATAHVCNAYPVPRHAINRGIAIEGVFSVLSGAFGTAHATTSYATNLSLLGITKICSRIVLIVAGVLACIVAVFGKFGALMTSVPDPVLGGIVLAVLGVLCSIGISAFESVQLRSSRNISVIGISIYLAIVMSEWQKQFPNSLKTDSSQINQLVKVTLGNAMFVGFVCSFILDNTVRGTTRERGVDKEIEENFLLGDGQVESRIKLYKIPRIEVLQEKYNWLRSLPFLQPYRHAHNNK